MSESGKGTLERKKSAKASFFEQPMPSKRKSFSEDRISELNALPRESSVREIRSLYNKGNFIPETRESFQQKMRMMSQNDKAMLRALYFYPERNKMNQVKVKVRPGNFVELQKMWDLNQKTGIIKEWSKTVSSSKNNADLFRANAEQALQSNDITLASVGEENWAQWRQAIDTVLQTLPDEPFALTPSNISSPYVLENMSQEECEIILRDFPSGVGSLPNSPQYSSLPFSGASFSGYGSLFPTTTEEGAVLEENSLDDHTEGALLESEEGEEGEEVEGEMIVESYHDDVWNATPSRGQQGKEDRLNLATPDKEECDTLPSSNPSSIVSPTAAAATAYSPLKFNLLSTTSSSADIKSPQSEAGMAQEKSGQVLHVVSAEEEPGLLPPSSSTTDTALSPTQNKKEGPQETLLLADPNSDTYSTEYESSAELGKNSNNKNILCASIALVGCLFVLLSLTLYATLYPQSVQPSKAVELTLPSMQLDLSQPSSPTSPVELMTGHIGLGGIADDIDKSILSIDNADADADQKALVVSDSGSKVMGLSTDKMRVQIKINIYQASTLSKNRWASAIEKLKNLFRRIIITLTRPFWKQ